MTNISQAPSCKNLCLKQNGVGCCSVGPDGCTWKVNAVAEKEELLVGRPRWSITCSGSGKAFEFIRKYKMYY